MNRKLLILGVLAIALLASVTFGIWGGSPWGDHTQITRIVPGADGETLVITDNGNRGFSPIFLFMPVLWFLVIGCVFSFFGRRRWGGGPGFGPPMATREAWLSNWHRGQHETGTDTGPATATATSQSTPDGPQE